MFAFLYFYRLKCLLRDRMLVFWTLLFSLVLATLFYFAFGRLTTEFERFEPIKVAVVDNPAYRTQVAFRDLLDNLSQSGEQQLLDLAVVDEATAEKMLEEDKVVGLIRVTDGLELVVKGPGLKQSILKGILDQYLQTGETVTRIVKENPGVLNELLAGLGNQQEYTRQVAYSDAVPETVLTYFYALIAMTCLYSGFWGLRNTKDIQADLSPEGARRSVAPTHKLQVVLADTAAVVTASFGEVLILLAYMALGLGIQFGSETGYVLLTCFAGCLVGVSLGNLIGTVLLGGEGVKVGVLIGVSMLMSFLSGLMYVEMKHIVDRSLPFLSLINPAALITDAFYSLYVYDTHQRFFMNIGMLLLLSLVMSLVSFFWLRRERYASI